MMNPFSCNEKIKYIFGYPDYSGVVEELHFLLSCSYGRLRGLYPYIEGNIIPSELLDIAMRLEYHYDAHLYSIMTLGIEGSDRILPSRMPKDMKHIKNPYRRHLRKLIDMIDDISAVITDAQYLDICNALQHLDLSAPCRNMLVYLEDYIDLLNKYNTLVYNAAKVCSFENDEEEENGQEGS